MFLNILPQICELSDDNKTKVGCLIVDNDENILAYGSNVLPDGLTYEKRRCETTEKHIWLHHAERNAIYKAARLGISLKGTKMYCTYFPCVDCARAIIQAGIIKLYTNKPDLNHEKWGDSWVNAIIMFKECGVELIWTNEI